MNNEINTEKKPASNSNEKKLSAGAGGGKRQAGYKLKPGSQAAENANEPGLSL